MEQLLNIFRLNIPTYFDPNELKDFESYVAHNPENYWIIAHGEEIVGGTGCIFYEEDSSGRITWIFFHPEYSGLGLGSLAVNHCHEMLKADNRVKKLVVTTSQHAHLFFEKFGYSIIRTEDNHWGEGLHLYWMERSIEGLL